MVRNIGTFVSLDVPQGVNFNMRIIIIGGGAAGFMAAITAAEEYPESEVIVLEKNRTVLNKVRISGGGRCNVTHACYDNRLMIRNYPRGDRFLKSLLPIFDAKDTVGWFESRGVPLKTEADGRIFPVTDSSETIIHCLVNQARQMNVSIQTNTAVVSFNYSSERKTFFIELLNKPTLEADRVLIATGGHPKRSGYEWITSHRHLIEDPVPSLFTFNSPDSYLLPLSGVTVQDTLVKITGSNFESRGPLLLTHWGFSGPAVIRLSAWGARYLAECDYQFTCRINWLPSSNEDLLRARLLTIKKETPKQKVASHAQFDLPLRLWQCFLVQTEASEDLRWIDISYKTINRLVSILTNSQFKIKGKSTFKEEFVTAGGVALSQVNSETLESKHLKGLFFAGEVLDVDGITGGFNFQNAWTTGYIAGKMISLP